MFGHDPRSSTRGRFPVVTGFSREVPVRLLCDEMLARLGRWLRAAGYDTEIAEGGASDRALVAHCAAEARTLLTRDRHLAEVAAARALPLLHCPRAPSRRKRGRCDMVSASTGNTPVHPLPGRQRAARPGSARSRGAVSAAIGRRRRATGAMPNCARLYWPGGHVPHAGAASRFCLPAEPCFLGGSAQPWYAARGRPYQGRQWRSCLTAWV